MIIDDLHVAGTRTFSPVEANPPLVVDADAVLVFAIPFPALKTVAGQGSQVSERNGGFQTIQLQTRGASDGRKRLDTLAGCEVAGSLVPIADNHNLD